MNLNNNDFDSMSADYLAMHIRRIERQRNHRKLSVIRAIDGGNSKMAAFIAETTAKQTALINEARVILINKRRGEANDR